MVDELARRCRDELYQLDNSSPVRCIATGGLANLVGTACSEIEAVDDYLYPPRAVYWFERNLGHHQSKSGLNLDFNVTLDFLVPAFNLLGLSFDIMDTVDFGWRDA